MNQNISIKLSSEAPKSKIEEDEFGLSQMVDSIADAIDRSFNERGYVIGIEGEWGSGKTTFSNFVIESLLSRKNSSLRILRFEPWLIGERQFLLSAFLGRLAIEVDSLVRYPIWKIHRWKQMYRRYALSKKIRKYGEYLGALATPVGALASIDATGYAGTAAVGLKSLSAISRQFGKRGKTVEDLKQQIIDQLNSLHKSENSANFLVVIDDTDRLEPKEAAEVMRLVRKVADFPFVTYLICFDRAILSEQISKAHEIKDGDAFIEKIVQLILSIPPMEPFALRRHLRRILTRIFPEEMSRGYSQVHGYSHRHSLVLDQWCGKFLNTPRDVARLVESLRAQWPTLRKSDLDFFDFIWLQLIKLKFPLLYTWTKRYLASVGAYRDRGRASTADLGQFAIELKNLLTPFRWSAAAYESGISEILPGCSNFVLEGEKQKVFDFGYGELSRFESERRLGSPSHWRYYFAFDIPSYAISDHEISEFRLAAARKNGDAAKILISLAKRPHEKPTHFVEALIDRLTDVPRESFTSDEEIGFLQAFSSCMDEIAVMSMEFEQKGHSDIWDKSCDLLNKNAATDFQTFVDTGKSLGWLAHVIRNQGFALGLAGNRPSEENKKWLSEPQVRSAVNSFVSRLRSVGAESFLGRPGAIGILFCWQQLGDEKGLRELLRDQTERDEVFILALRAMRGWSAGSDGVKYPLHRDYVAYFMDPDEAKARLEILAVNSRVSADAAELLGDWSNRSMS